MARSSMAITIMFYVLANSAGMAHGSAFRGNSQSRAVLAKGSVKADSLRAAMLDEIMAALGSGNRVTEFRLQKIEDTLRPIFQSLPKNTHGKLDHSAAHYALQRLFVLRHGMYIKGWQANNGAGSNSSSPTEVLNGKVPDFLQTMFEQRLNGQGLGLHEIAVLATIIEHLIHDEAVERLKAAYRIGTFDADSRLSTFYVGKVIDTYMILLLMGMEFSTVTYEQIQDTLENPSTFYGAWEESQAFTQNALLDILSAKFSSKGDFEKSTAMLSFSEVAQVVEEIVDRFGGFQNKECKDLKAALVKLETPGTGRVSLKNFYSTDSEGPWQFTESVEYLRKTGVLDETDPSRKSVIIANYVNSASNCGASSTLYDVCCLNECEGLLGHLEKELAEPAATVDRIISLVSNLPSSTVQAPRTISSDLRSRLEQIASHHKGLVPLHGRLFGQWMHHAYPRECPYPHKAGTTTRVRAEEWKDGKGAATEEEIDLYINEDDEDDSDAVVTDDEEPTVGNVSMWTTEEELFVSVKAPVINTSSRSSTRGGIFFAGVAFIGVAFFGASRGTKGNSMLPMFTKDHLV